MPVINLNKNYLLELISDGITHEEVKSQLGKLGIGIEAESEDSISLEISANRPDLLGAVGIARALRNFMHKTKHYSYSVGEGEPELTIRVGRNVKSIRPFFSAIVVKNASLTEESVSDMMNFAEKFCETHGRSRKKLAIGIHDLGRVDAKSLAYDAYGDEYYIPLNKTAQMKYSEVISGEPKGIEYGWTISNRKNLYPALKDSNGTLSLIPILNSERTRISQKTKDMLVDITGTSEWLVKKTADMLACMFMDMKADVRKARVISGNKERIFPEMSTGYITMQMYMAQAQIGVMIGPNNILSLANKMGYDAAAIGNKVRFRIPEYRLDVFNEQDVIEDIAIGYGYDYIQPLPIIAWQKGELEGNTKIAGSISDIMTGMGFSEMMNSYLTNDEINYDKMMIKRSEGAARLKNPKARTINMMRTWLLPSLMKNLALSVHEKMPQRIYEYDMVFAVEKGMPKESYHLAAVSADPKSNFNYIKSVVEGMAYLLGLDMGVAKKEHKSFIEGRCASILLGKKEIGFFGELHPEVLANFGIEEPVTAMELELQAK